MQASKTLFAEYAMHGWRLAPIAAGTKGPTAKGWNHPDAAITHPVAASRLEAAGLCHAYSGTCAIDIDDYAAAKLWLADRGIDLDHLASHAVQIKSPAANRGKLIYQMPVPLPSKKIYGKDKSNVIDFRCGTANGLTVQDVLPPSPHPNEHGIIDGNYEWVGDWRHLSPIPNKLYALWQSLISTADEYESEPTMPRSQLVDLLKTLDPDMGRDDWIRVGMAIHHEYGGSEEGFRLWDAWSRQGEKYVGSDMRACWSSFTPGSGITANSLITMQDIDADDFPDEGQLQRINEAADRPKAPIRLYTARELLEPHDSPPQLVQGILERGAEASLIGPSKSYKTLWALQLGVSVATGTPFFGHEAEQGLVVYLCGEGFGGFRHRLQALRHGLDIDFSDAPFVVYPRPVALPTVEGVKAVRQYIRAAEEAYNQKLTLLIIDTYGRYSAGEENVAEDLYKFFRAASACREHAALLVVHHTGHSDASRGRGTSAWEQAVDTEFVASIRSDTDTRIFENTKQKDSEPCPPMFFRLARHKTDSTRVGEPIYSVILEPTVIEAPAPKLGANEQIVYDVIQENSGADQEDVINAAVSRVPKPDGRDKRREYMRRAMTGLISKNVVELHGDLIFLSGDITAEFRELLG